jgi:hypothetical protein
MHSLSIAAVSTAEPQVDHAARSLAGAAALRQIRELERLLGGLVASWHASPPLTEGRSAHRVRYERPLLLTPIDSRSHSPSGEPQLVRGRDLSLGGCSFCHPDPLPCARVGLTFGLEDEQQVTMMLRLTWCRFTQDRVYQSGGRFLKPIDLRVEESFVRRLIRSA